MEGIVPLFKVNSITKRFGNHIVFKNISFILNCNGSLLITGKSGSGKTTLLRCLALLENIDSGEIFFDENLVNFNSHIIVPNHFDRGRIGMVFQNLFLWNNYSVEENISLPLRIKGATKRESMDKTLEILEKLGIADKKNFYPSELSGGQQQRVAIARALVHKPKVLLLDEITSNLDERGAKEVMNIVLELHASGIAVVIVSHTPYNIPHSLRNNHLILEYNEISPSLYK